MAPALVHTTLKLYNRALSYIEIMGIFLGNDQINCHNMKSPVISLIPGITIAILFQTQREHTTLQRSDVKCVPDLKIEPICPKS